MVGAHASHSIGVASGVTGWTLGVRDHGFRHFTNEVLMLSTILSLILPTVCKLVDHWPARHARFCKRSEIGKFLSLEKGRFGENPRWIAVEVPEGL